MFGATGIFCKALMKWWRGDMLSTAEGTTGLNPALARFGIRGQLRRRSGEREGQRHQPPHGMFAMKLRPAT